VEISTAAQSLATLSEKVASFLGIHHNEVSHYETTMQWQCSRHT